MREMTAS